MSRNIPVIDVSRRTGPGRELLPWERGHGRTTAEQDLVAERAAARGLDIEEDRHNVLVLNYTMACPLACDFCCYACGPRRTETMELALALDLVDQAADLGVFGAASFTGGDPFVYYDDMVEISRRMADHRLPFDVISACAWATDDATVDAMLQPLIDNGMTGITASHDPSHERWVPRENIARVVSRAVDLGVKAGIYGTFYDATRAEGLFPEFTGNERVSFESRPVASGVGRLKHTLLSRSAFPGADFGGDTCYRRVYHDVTVFWDGEVYPCCSVYNRATPGISYGNVHATPLHAIWDRIEGSLFLRTVKRSGFAALYTLLQRLDPELARGLPDPDNVIGACQLCNQLMSDADLSRRVHDVLAKEERRRVRRLVLQ